MSANRRAGREKELRAKLKACADRYETVFGKTLSVNDIRFFCDEEEKREKLTFLRDRVGQLSFADVGYVRQIIKSGEVAPELPPKLDEVEEEEEQAELEELNFNDGEDESEEELTA